jgi:predicted enzyme related to lactoylglutathione lyase
MATGEITHVEFPADDVERAKRFYAAVAGWEFGEAEGFADYWLFRTGPGSGGGLGRRGESVGRVVRLYVTVASLESALEAAAAHGGSIVHGGMEIPGMGRYGVVLDSEGNEIGLWESAPG